LARLKPNWSGAFENDHIFAFLCPLYFLANQVEWDDRLEEAAT
jgi:hypothetical protein